MKRVGVAVLIAGCVVALAPIVWHVISSLKTADEILRIPPTLFPHTPTISNYVKLFRRRLIVIDPAEFLRSLPEQRPHYAGNAPDRLSIVHHDRGAK